MDKKNIHAFYINCVLTEQNKRDISNVKVERDSAAKKINLFLVSVSVSVIILQALVWFWIYENELELY